MRTGGVKVKMSRRGFLSLLQRSVKTLRKLCSINGQGAAENL